MKKHRHLIKRLFLNDNFILALVLLNCFVIFLQCYDYKIAFMGFYDNIFTLLFTFEMAIKIKEFGWKNYWRSSWNKIDFVITTISLLSLIQFITYDPYSQALGYITVLRALRALKLIRILKFIPDLGKILSGLRRAIKTTYFIIIAFLIIIFIVSIVTCVLFKNLSPEYFSNPIDSIYSTFRIFTVEGWYEIPDSIVDGRDSGLMRFLVRLYFSTILFFGGIIGVSIINSLLVDTMAEDNNDEVLEHIKNLERQIEELNKKIEDKE
ncbi:MAG: ion transporter [Candidatus Limimorpha sp.]